MVIMTDNDDSGDNDVTIESKDEDYNDNMTDSVASCCLYSY